MVANEELDPVEQAVRNPDVYVFYTGTTGRVEALDPNPDKDPEFRFLADLEPLTEGWLWSAMAIVKLEDLYDVKPVADRVLGGRDDTVDDAEKPGHPGERVLRRTRHFPHFGFARLRLAAGKALELLNAINDDTVGYSGSALIAGGRFDMLVELGGATPGEMEQSLAALGDLEGVEEVQSGRVVGEFYYEGTRRMIGESEETAS